jgi:hypothetical protein
MALYVEFSVWSSSGFVCRYLETLNSLYFEFLIQSVTVDTACNVFGAMCLGMQQKHQDLSHRRKTMFKMLILATDFFDNMCLVHSMFLMQSVKA